MYGGNAGRIYNPQVDPLERGPPKRVLRDETHIGEMVAASKKRISWRFTLGESDTVHEVVLTHSIMSYKKLVEYDGRQMHFSSTATPGDWHYTMVLDGLNMVFEVRINDIESLDIPKYDFLIDRVPFRRWDVYRRKKQPITTGTYAQPNAQPSGGYGQHKWGPAGAVPPSHDQGQRRSFTGAPSQYDQGQRGSFTGAPSQHDQGQRGSFTGPPPGNRTRSFSGNRDPQQARARSSSGHQQQWGGNSQQYAQEQTPSHYHERSSLPERPTPASFAAANSGAAPPPAPAHHHQQRATAKKQPVINLIDDFGPSVSVSAQSLLFDPLAGSKSAQPPNVANANGQAAYQPPQQAQAPAQVQPVQQPYVDPFASSAPLKPTAAPMSLDPFANQRQQYVQQPQQQPHVPQQFQQPPRPMGAAPMQPQLAGQTTRSSLTGGYPAPAGMGQANFNISQLMNPVALSGAPAPGQPKSINIDPFAGMSR